MKNIENILKNSLEYDSKVETEKILEHSRKVNEIALEISDKLNLSHDDKNIISIGALLHDSRKLTGNKHNELGAKYIDTLGAEELNCSEEDKERIKITIIWHKGDGPKYLKKNYSKRDIRLLEIIRAADKTAKLYKKLESPLNERFDVATKKINDLTDVEVKTVALEILNYRYEELTK